MNYYQCPECGGVTLCAENDIDAQTCYRLPNCRGQQRMIPVTVTPATCPVGVTPEPGSLHEYTIENFEKHRSAMEKLGHPTLSYDEKIERMAKAMYNNIRVKEGETNRWREFAKVALAALETPAKELPEGVGQVSGSGIPNPNDPQLQLQASSVGAMLWDSKSHICVSKEFILNAIKEKME